MKSITQSLLFFLAMGVFFHPACADESPNILFIAIDDLRDWVGHLGFNSQVKTPNIDRLAKRGVSFSQAHCAAPLCNPSRISLLTGIAPFRSGVYGNGENSGSTGQRDHRCSTVVNRVMTFVDAARFFMEQRRDSNRGTIFCASADSASGRSQRDPASQKVPKRGEK